MYKLYLYNGPFSIHHQLFVNKNSSLDSIWLWTVLEFRYSNRKRISSVDFYMRLHFEIYRQWRGCSRPSWNFGHWRSGLLDVHRQWYNEVFNCDFLYSRCITVCLVTCCWEMAQKGVTPSAVNPFEIWTPPRYPLREGRTSVCEYKFCLGLPVLNAICKGKADARAMWPFATSTCNIDL